MKKILFILLFAVITTASFGQAAAASSRMFKSAKAWEFREFLRTARSYTMDTASLYATIRLTRDLQGYANWEYATFNVDTCFASFFPIIGGTNSPAANESYYLFNNVTRYSSHRFFSTGSPTYSKYGITTNGTTQYLQLQYYKDWHLSYQLLSPQLLMDTILNRAATDTVANTKLNLAIYMKDSADKSSFTSEISPNFFQIIQPDNRIFTRAYNGVVGEGSLVSSGYPNGSGLSVTARNGLVNAAYKNGNLVHTNTNASYNFSLPRNINNYFFLQQRDGTVYYAGTVQYAAILKRAFDASEQTFFNKTITEFVRRKTQ